MGKRTAKKAAGLPLPGERLAEADTVKVIDESGPTGSGQRVFHVPAHGFFGTGLPGQQLDVIKHVLAQSETSEPSGSRWILVHSVSEPPSPHRALEKAPFTVCEEVLRNCSGTVFDRAVDVLGGRQEAFRWLGTPVPALGFETPIALAATSDGQKRVLAVLDQFEHGVY